MDPAARGVVCRTSKHRMVGAQIIVSSITLDVHGHISTQHSSLLCPRVPHKSASCTTCRDRKNLCAKPSVVYCSLLVVHTRLSSVCVCSCAFRRLIQHHVPLPLTFRQNVGLEKCERMGVSVWVLAAKH